MALHKPSLMQIEWYNEVMDNHEKDDEPRNTSNNAGSKHENKPFLIAVIILAVLAVSGCCFGIYGMFFSNKDSDEPRQDNNSVVISNVEDDDTIDVYADRDVKHKTLRLLGYRNGVSNMEFHDPITGNFVVNSDYMPIKELLSNSLTDQTKVYITLETTSLDKDKICSYRGDDTVKSDIDSIDFLSDAQLDFATIDCISYDNAGADYYDLFGEDIPMIKGYARDYGDFAYGENLGAFYYHIMGGRGGTGASYIVGKINRVVAEDEFIKVNMNAGTLQLSGDEPGQLYSGIMGDELYKTYDAGTDWSFLGLTDEDYGSFDSYSFIFKKNGSGFYSFVGVEESAD